jgi:hypothetical protein
MGPALSDQEEPRSRSRDHTCRRSAKTLPVIVHARRRNAGRPVLVLKSFKRIGPVGPCHPWSARTAIIEAVRIDFVDSSGELVMRCDCVAKSNTAHLAHGKQQLRDQITPQQLSCDFLSRAFAQDCRLQTGGRGGDREVRRHWRHGGVAWCNAPNNILRNAH